MSGISALFDIGRSALFASQRVLAVIGQNIANVNTPGYSRQQAVLTEAQPLNGSPGQIGMGVRVAEIRRFVDSFLEGQLTTSFEQRGQLTLAKNALFQIQGLLGAEVNQGIGAALTEFFGSLQDVATNPSDTTARTVLLAKASTLAQKFSQTATDLKSYRKSLDLQVAQAITEINGLATQIADLNSKIQAAESQGQNANDLRDQRGVLVNQLAGLLEVSTIEDETGQLIVFVGRGQPLVFQNEVHKLVGVASASNEGFFDVQYETGTTGKLSISSLITSGRLKGLLDVRDATIPGLLTSLDLLAASLVHEVNQVHRGGYGLDGTTGVDFFTPLSVYSAAKSSNTGAATIGGGAITANSLLTLHQYEIRFSAANTYAIVDATTGKTIKGNYTGTVISPPTEDAPLTITNGVNDQLIIEVDGAAPVTITLTAGAYTSGAELATEIQSKMAAAGKNVTVTFDTTANRFVIMSTDTTSSSDINVSGGNARSSLGLLAGIRTKAVGTYSSPQTFHFDGISVTLTGAPANAGDIFLVNSWADTAKNIAVALTEASKVAASSTKTGVPGNNANALLLASLQSKTIESLGNVTFNSYYSSAVTHLGALVQKAEQDLKAQNILHQQLEGFRAEVSGVSLDEELVNMLKFQRAFQAASRLIVMTDELLQDLLFMKR